jgi:hypothetical protein
VNSNSGYWHCAANNQGHRQPGRRKVAPTILAGLVFDAEGDRYTPTYLVKKGGRYRYYTSQAVIQRRKKSSYIDRIPATSSAMLSKLRRRGRRNGQSWRHRSRQILQTQGQQIVDLQERLSRLESVISKK